MKQKNDVADIFIYGEIVSYKWDDADTTALSFKQELDNLGTPNEIHLHVNSPGGSVFEGIAIGNMLKHHSARVIAHVDALAASIASVIVASADEVIMPANSMLMIHNPFVMTMGNANELRKQADDLDAVAQSSVITYLSKSGDKLTEERIVEIMDNETWLSANEAYEIGLCDVVEGENKSVATADTKFLEKYQHAPEKLFLEKQQAPTVEYLEQLVKKTSNDKKYTEMKVEEIYNG